MSRTLLWKLGTDIMRWHSLVKPTYNINMDIGLLSEYSPVTGQSDHLRKADSPGAGAQLQAISRKLKAQGKKELAA